MSAASSPLPESAAAASLKLRRANASPLSSPAARRQFRGRLLAWFDAHARDLPWRRTRDPYAIWISEIMLQQTRVAAVVERYVAFMDRFPTIATLAAAEEADVLAMWSGLGYYRRARMMHRAARGLTEAGQTQLPATAAELAILPGIGSYTSAAIASIGFGEPIAAVDGNVERVILRLFGWGEGTIPEGSDSGSNLVSRIRMQAARLIEDARPGDYNQAMMELGATICLPRRPLCLHCPVYDYCLTRGEHPTAPRARMRTESIAYALVRRAAEGNDDSESVLLEQRPVTQTVMSGMWELPLVPVGLAAPSRTVFTLRHAIMQVNYSAAIAAVAESELPPSPVQRRWFGVPQLPSLPLTGLARKALIAAGLFVQRP